MPRILIAGLLWVLSSAVAAQGAAEQLAAVEQQVERKEWTAALESLLRVRDAVGSEAEQRLAATLLAQVGMQLFRAGAFDSALTANDAGLGLLKVLNGNQDHPDVVTSQNNVAVCLQSLGRAGEALPLYESSLAMKRRLLDKRDHPEVARSLEKVAGCLSSLGRAHEALPHYEALLAMRKRLVADANLADVVKSRSEDVVKSLNEVAVCLQSLGRADEAMSQCEESLAMCKRLFGDSDHTLVAATISNAAGCLEFLGRAGDALPQFEASLAMRKRLFGDRDHSSVATGLNNLANCLDTMGRADEALPLLEASLGMRKRLHGDRDHPSVAQGLNNVAACLSSLGRMSEALLQYEASLAMRKRLYGDGDHPGVAESLNNLAGCLDTLDRADEALRLYEASLAMQQRLFGDRDHPDVSTTMNNVANCLQVLGRAGEALPKLEESLAMCKRLFGDRDHPDVAKGLSNVASCLEALGRAGDALPMFEASQVMWKHLVGDRDHPDAATNLDKHASCLAALGRAGEALPRFEASLAMSKRLFGDRDHRDVVMSLNNVASCLEALGRAGDALPLFEASLVMQKRLVGVRANPAVASILSNLAGCLESLGRTGEALTKYEASLVMRRRHFGDRDHPDMAAGLNNVAHCLKSLGRVSEALTLYEAALAIAKRLFGQRDHPDVASILSNVASCNQSLGRAGEALPQLEAAREMKKRIFGDRDHPAVAHGLSNVAYCLESLGRTGEALPLYEASLAMQKRLFGDRDHPHVATSLNSVGFCLQALGRVGEALECIELSCAMMERLREESRTAPSLRQSLFDDLKRNGAFEQLQHLAARLDRPADALRAAERSRGREALDLLEQQHFDPLAEAERRVRQRGDESSAQRLVTMRTDLEGSRLESDRLLHLLTTLDEEALGDGDRARRRQQLIAQSNAVTTRLRQLLDERARLLGDVLPVGRVRTASEIQTALKDGELFLEFTVTEAVSFLYVLARDGEVVAIPLPAAHAAGQRVLPELVRASSHALVAARGRDAEAGSPADAEAATRSRTLFEAMIPKTLWPRLQSARRVFISQHRELHRLPFELLVTDTKDGRPVYWLDNGPAIAYVPSGSALHWLRKRAKDASDDATQFDLLAVGDPGELAKEPEVPEEGAFIMSVQDGGEGARAGLRPRDVLLSYDGKAIVDDTTLRDLRPVTEAAIEDGKRADIAIPLEVWRVGETLKLEVKKGVLGIQVGKGKARPAWEASLGIDAQLARVTRVGDLERLRQLSPLRGARAETQAIEEVFTGKQAKTKRLLGALATEPDVFALAAKAKYLHFACHGIAEEYAGQSLSMLVLSQPEHVLPEDDGLLKLDDLLHRWRGRLSSCRLVVLSACRTNVGPSFRDDAPQALPLGFLFAGASSVISSLWAVDDESTRVLMTDFYQRLLAGEKDRLKAFTDAKKALRAKYPDPFHWAPFLYMGSPE